MCSLVGIESILVPIEPTGIEANATTVLTDGDSLRAWTECILNIDIIHLKVVLVNAEGAARVVGTSLTGRNPSLDRDLIVLVRGCIRGVSINLNQTP